MAIGTVLVGVALTAVVAAYLAHPFRVVDGGDDRAIEAWVSRVREKQGRKRAGERRGREIEEINFCPQCGRQVGSDDRFCAGCGRPLR